MDFDTSWDAVLKPGGARDYFELSPRPEFHGDTIEFSPGNAWWLAELARLVYRPDGQDPLRSSILEGVNLCIRLAFDVEGTHGLLLGPRDRKDRDFGILVFRGTLEFRNWVTNLRALPTDWGLGGRVHWGFRRALSKAWKQIHPALETVGGPLLYTGHSLGAALATLAASLKPPRAVYTFGSPRVGDTAFADSLARIPIHRVVNQRDLVPNLPPPGGAFDFCHVGTTHHLGPGGSASVPEAGEPPAVPFIPPGWLNLAPPAFLTDHAPVNYVAAIEQLL